MAESQDGGVNPLVAPNADSKGLAKDLEVRATTEGSIAIAMSSALVTLLSEQLYQSPLKAIEELVVNAYDAGASECRVVTPTSEMSLPRRVVVFDNGEGMDREGLTNLWHIGRSTKSEEHNQAKRLGRKQIGKFGIGKLATYAIANTLTYLTRSGDRVLGVTVDFRQFSSAPPGSTPAVDHLPVWGFEIGQLKSLDEFARVSAASGVSVEQLLGSTMTSWTMAILENLKPRGLEINNGMLRWVLATAMPVKNEFSLYLNDVEVVSAKETQARIANFELADLPERRLKNLEAKGFVWTRRDGKLFSTLFPEGVYGDVVVTRNSLFTGKSSDLGRSHGFFVRVRDRLVSLEDPEFGIAPQSFTVFYRFRCNVWADDLNSAVTAAREALELSPPTLSLRALLEEVFLESRQRYDVWEKDRNAKDSQKPEPEQTHVAPELVERPTGDVLAGVVNHPTAGVLATSPDPAESGGEADKSYFYLDIDRATDVAELVKRLYEPERNKSFEFVYANLGRNSRMVRFRPAEAQFTLNQEHPFIQAFAGDGSARVLLEDLVTAEALLEVYLHEFQVARTVVGEVLERRDRLFRSLMKDHPYTPSAIAGQLRSAFNDERELETALIAAVRVLGFVANHVSRSGEPDGLARCDIAPDGQFLITLEAKSSGGQPRLGGLDIAGLKSHKKKHSAHGCLLVAPSYPGADDPESEVSARSIDAGVSCWTIEQLARVVEAAERRHISAREVLKIVLYQFSPLQVTAAVEALLSEPSYAQRDLYRAIVKALRTLAGRLRGRPRTEDVIASEVQAHPPFQSTSFDDIVRGIHRVVAASQGGLEMTSSNAVIVLTDYDELERRLSKILGEPGAPARPGETFRRGGNK